MRCFYHQDREAIGICKSCAKGLCPECVVELPKGLACRGRCEADVKAVTDLIDRNIQLSATSSSMLRSGRGLRSSTAIFQFVTGGLFIAWGLSDFERLKFLILIGAGFIAYGAYWLFLARSVPKQKSGP